MLRTRCRLALTRFPTEFGLGIAGAALLWTPPARAQRGGGDAAGSASTHEVASGETLTEIARQYGVEVDELQRVNDIDDPDRIRVGQELRIPADGGERSSGSGGERSSGRAAERSSEDAGDEREARVTRAGVVLYVAEGQTLSDIAASYDVSVSRVLRANDLEDANALRVGQRLLIPGATEVATVRRVRREDPDSNPVTFVRVATDEEVTVRLFDGRGRLRSQARESIERIFRQPSTGRTHRISTDLLKLLQKVADHWPGRRILVYSGYRPYRRDQATPKSKHNSGHAVDFRVEGVSNGELRDYCRTFSRAGVGYYPNSHFVHLDARDDRGYWVDYSGPGEAPRYGREGREPAEGDGSDPEAAADRDTEGAGRSGGGEADGDGSGGAEDAEPVVTGVETVAP
ncbi:MAG: LysM peptidoglycan-binding domain-containing protein [Deltaproteobacteria bacterium]|nr:LysM peptidoglycan-binding domain-containing protein [Deltaproteobacteria bacterium]